MAKYDQNRIKSYFRKSDKADTNAAKGSALEDLVCYLFDKIPGVEVTQRNKKNAFGVDEMDIAVWNNKQARGLPFLPNIFFIECKNRCFPVSSMEVNWFAEKLGRRGRDTGILIASSGITGDAGGLTHAHFIIASQLLQRRYIIVITRHEIAQLRTTNDLVRLIRVKLCLLGGGGALT